MFRGFASACLCVVAVACPAIGTASPDDNANEFAVSSPDVHSGQPFSKATVANNFGCTGGNFSPALQWTGAPAGTKSFVITLFDPDEHGSPSGWWHWIVYDVPASVHSLPRNAGVDKGNALPPGAAQGRNDEGKLAYAGPCPDEGDTPHHYVLTIYALKVAKLPVPRGASGANVTYTAREFTLGVAKIVALHGRADSARVQ